jgi:6-pyruvoyltetrahydropterin/6-carboxytetrahydropterin synthase
VLVTFERRFSMAHRLRHSGSFRCATPHGHNELVQVELSYACDLPLDAATNMAADFGDLKRRWHAWIDQSVDHALQLGADDPLIGYFRASEAKTLARVMVLPGDPTTEILCAAFFYKLDAFLLADCASYAAERVTVVETPTNKVSIDRSALGLFPSLALPG